MLNKRKTKGSTQTSGDVLLTAPSGGNLVYWPLNIHEENSEDEPSWAERTSEGSRRSFSSVPSDDASFTWSITSSEQGALYPAVDEETSSSNPNLTTLAEESTQKNTETNEEKGPDESVEESTETGRLLQMATIFVGLVGVGLMLALGSGGDDDKNKGQAARSSARNSTRYYYQHRRCNHGGYRAPGSGSFWLFQDW